MAKQRPSSERALKQIKNPVKLRLPALLKFQRNSGLELEAPRADDQLWIDFSSVHRSVPQGTAPHR
jgi:hypothetical protein